MDKQEITKILSNVKKRIQDKFFDLSVYIYKEDYEYFIAIRNERIYNSEKYQELIFEITSDYLMQQGIFDVHFICCEGERIHYQEILQSENKPFQKYSISKNKINEIALTSSFRSVSYGVAA